MLNKQNLQKSFFANFLHNLTKLALEQGGGRGEEYLKHFRVLHILDSTKQLISRRLFYDAEQCRTKQIPAQ